MVLHKIKDIQNFNTLCTSNCPFHPIHFMTNETYWNCTKFTLKKIHKYTKFLKVISLNYNPYNSCNHFSKSWGCRILFVYTQSLAPFTMNAPRYSPTPLKLKKIITIIFWTMKSLAIPYIAKSTFDWTLMFFEYFF